MGKEANGVVLFANATEFQLLLTNRFEALKLTTDDLDTYSNNISTTIMDTAVQTTEKDKPDLERSGAR